MKNFKQVSNLEEIAQLINVNLDGQELNKIEMNINEKQRFIINCLLIPLEILRILIDIKGLQFENALNIVRYTLKADSIIDNLQN